MTAPAVRVPIAEVVAELAARPEEEQLALLPVPAMQGDGRAERARDLVRQHRAGRPPGARNLATRQALDFVRRVLGDPLIERARMAMHTPESLSMMLGCTKLEAAQHIDSIRADLQRLFYAPLAPVDGEGNAVVPQFNMLIGGATQAGAEALPPWERHLLEMQKNPAKSTDAEPVSHDDVSHDEPK